MEQAFTYTTHCLTTGARVSVEPGPEPGDDDWSYDCSACGRRHYPSRGAGRRIDLLLNVDLGELIPGQHVVIEGIGMRYPWGSVLHNAFVPGFARSAKNTDWGLLHVADDVGTNYEDHVGEGGWGADPDGIVRHGDESLGNGVPPSATRLTIEFNPAHDWDPPSPWIRVLTIELSTGEVTDTIRGGPE